MYPDTEPDLLGKTFGPYVIRQRLGKGGMGMVYLAQDTTLDRLVAMKFLLERFTHDPDVVNRFQREARAAAKLNHPNIVQVHAVDIAARPPFIVMEYVQGASADQMLADSGPFTWQNALSICGQAASALGCAHEQGIIHRDIKPANIMIDGAGRARVADFGIAKVMGANTTLTAAQVSLGSPCYMSPEQCGTGGIVPASDLFALGITIFEMITGTLPFTSETQLGLIKKLTRDPLPRLDAFVPGVPEVVQQFLETLTAKDPRQRYFSASQVVEDLRAMHHGQTPPHMAALRGGGSAIAVNAESTRDALPPAQPAPKSLVDELYEGTAMVERKAHIDNPMPRILMGTAGAIVLVMACAAAYQIYFAIPGPPPPPPVDGETAETLTPVAVPEKPAITPQPQNPPPHPPGVRLHPPGLPPPRGGFQPGTRLPPGTQPPPRGFPPPLQPGQRPPGR